MVGENFVALVAGALADSVLTAKHFGGAAMTDKGQNRVINARPVQVIEPRRLTKLRKSKLLITQ